MALAGVVAAGAGAWIALASGNDGAAETGLIDSRKPEVGERAPDFALLDARDGSTVRRLSDYRGRYVILNWYASWCGPCRDEIPSFQEAYSYLSGDLVVLGINLEEDRDTAAGLLSELGADYPAVLDSEGVIARHYRVRGLPTTLFLDRDGKIIEMGAGIITEETLRAELAKLGLEYPDS